MTPGSTPDRQSFDSPDAQYRSDRYMVLLDQANGVSRQLRQLLRDETLLGQDGLRLALADELIQEIDVLGLALHRPAVRQATLRVRRAIGLPSGEPSAVPMSLATALAFLSLAIAGTLNAERPTLNAER